MVPIIDSSCDHPSGRHAMRLLRRQARVFLSTLRLERVELSLVLTTDAAIQGLNRSWRKKDRATDVLSFPAATAPRVRGGCRPLGDIVISLDTARARAKEGHRRLGDELALYLAHGLLHLLGHDHEDPAQARRMARLETRLLGTLGMVGRAIDPAETSATGGSASGGSPRGSSSRRG